MLKLKNSRPIALVLATDVIASRPAVRLAVSLGFALAYLPVLLLLVPIFGPVASALSIVPGVLAGWMLGIRGGLLAALLLFTANTAVLLSWGAHDPRSAIPGIAMLFVASAAAGWARSAFVMARHRAADADLVREAAEHMSRELRRSYESLDAVLETAPLQLAQLDERGVITSFRGSSLIGLPIAPADLVGRSLLELRGDHPQLPHLLRRALLGEQIAETVAIGDRWEHIRMTPVLGPDGRVRTLNTVSLDVTEREAALEAARQLASADPLTGLANRDRLIELGSQSLQKPGAAIGVLSIDLDGFRELNAALGHGSGDEILRIVAKRLSSAVGTSDTVARFGGNGFVVLLSAVRAEQVGGIVKRIQAVFERPIEMDGNALEVSASIGSSCGPEADETFDGLLHRAEIAMHEAKRLRSGHFAYTAALVGADKDRVTLVADLRRAIEDDSLELEYQPIISLEDMRTVGVEALLRWWHPERGAVAPASFIPFVERSLLGRRLSRWVARRMWHDTRTLATIAGPLTFAMNLSARDLASPEVLEELKALRARVGTSGRVVAEITESDVMADPERAIDALTALRAIGIKIAIDDFGTGYSSLAYLHRLPVDELKIDRAFVSRLVEDERAREIVRATITIAHALNLKVTGEGAEDQRTLEILRELGCDRAQGWAISKSMRVERLAAWLFEQARAPIAATVLRPLVPDFAAAAD
jgi:diguanylate cyclase (GGDEF)-like protein